jgi:uncharacterized membrane protein YoaK (UPF0700 family)
MSPDIRPPDKWLSFGLAFVGGYCDAAGLLLAKTFTGHVTGNLVLAAITIAAYDWRGTLEHLSAVVCFLIGILFSVLMARPLAAWPLLSTTMGIEVILIVAGYLALLSHVTAGVEIFVVCVSLALGLQNGVFRRTGGISVHTTFLTGMITGLITTQAEKLTSQVAPRPVTASDPKFSLVCGIWASFVVGAGVGAAMVFRFKKAGILGAALGLFAIIVRNSITARLAHSASRSY